MKKLISLLLVLSMLFPAVNVSAMAEDISLPAGALPQAGFSGMGDPALLRYTESVIYDELVTALNSDEYFVENVSAVYISQEYLDELQYNSRANIYFGYTLEEVTEQFEGKKFVFTLGDDGSTIVTEFEEYDDVFDRALKNVAIGTGVILICVTVSVVSAGLGAPAVSMIFAASAKTGTIMAVSGGTLGGVSAGIVTAVQTGDMDAAFKAAALSGSEAFKWGAISGAVKGGGTELKGLYGAARNGLTMNQAAIIQKESKYPLDVIKQFKTMDEYQVYKKAGLYPQIVNGKTALVQDIDLDYTSMRADGTKVTNLQLMKDGYAPIDPYTGKAYQLHHIGQSNNATLAVLSEKQHLSNASILNTSGKGSEINRAVFDKVRKEFWETCAEIAEFKRENNAHA